MIFLVQAGSTPVVRVEFRKKRSLSYQGESFRLKPGVGWFDSDSEHRRPCVTRITSNRGGLERSGEVPVDADGDSGIGLEVGRGVWDALLVGSTPSFPTIVMMATREKTVRLRCKPVGVIERSAFGRPTGDVEEWYLAGLSNRKLRVRSPSSPPIESVSVW